MLKTLRKLKFVAKKTRRSYRFHSPDDDHPLSDQQFPLDLDWLLVNNDWLDAASLMYLAEATWLSRSHTNIHSVVVNRLYLEILPATVKERLDRDGLPQNAWHNRLQRAWKRELFCFSCLRCPGEPYQEMDTFVPICRHCKGWKGNKEVVKERMKRASAQIYSIHGFLSSSFAAH